MAKPDYYLKLDGPNIKGESQGKDHEDEIQLIEFAWGEAQEGAGAAGGGSGAGKVKMKDLTVKMLTNTSGPELIRACASGKQFDSAVLTCRKPGGQQQDYLRYSLKEVIVTSYDTEGKEVQLNGEPEVIPVDQVRLGFAEIKVEYRAQKPDGTFGPWITAGYNRKKGVPT